MSVTSMQTALNYFISYDKRLLRKAINYHNFVTWLSVFLFLLKPGQTMNVKCRSVVLFSREYCNMLQLTLEMSNDVLVKVFGYLRKSAPVQTRPTLLAYVQLIAAEANASQTLISKTRGSQCFCFHLNQLLNEILLQCVEHVFSKVFILWTYPQQLELLKEFYRVVKEATNLMRSCCDESSWLLTAFYMVDGNEAFSLRIREFTWCTRTITGKATLFLEGCEAEELRTKWTSAVDKDRHHLKQNLKSLHALGLVEGAETPKACHLARFVTERLPAIITATDHDPEGAASQEVPTRTADDAAQPNVIHLNLEGIRVKEDKPMGAGGCASVYEAEWCGEELAVKVFRNPESCTAEASTASKLHHPHIVPVMGCIRGRVSGDPDMVVMELVSSSLSSLLDTRTSQANSPRWSRQGIEAPRSPFPLLVAVDMILQLAEAMRYLHQERVAHLDLKPSNILVRPVSDPELARLGYVILKLVDFGCAESNVASCTLMYKPYVGTTRYRAPEILQGRFTRAVDVYGFALVCYEILTGLKPFQQFLTLQELCEKVRNGARPQWRSCDSGSDYPPIYLKKLIEACWNGDANKRPGFAKICLELHHIKSFLLTGLHEKGFTDSTIEEASTMHRASEQETAERDSRDVYFQLSRDAVQRMSDLTSTRNAYPSSTGNPFPSRKLQLNTLQCQHLVEALQTSLEEVRKHMNSDTKPSEVALTEFYRIVIASERLLEHCCEKNWLKAAIWLVNCKEAFSMRLLNLLWCTAVITGDARQEAIEALGQRVRSELENFATYAKEERRSLKSKLEHMHGDYSEYERALASYLSHRLDDRTVFFDINPDDLSTLQAIGEGTHAIVYRSTFLGEPVAVKVYPKCIFSGWESNTAKKNACTLAKLKHPCIVPMIGVYDDHDSYSLVMELMSGNLCTLMDAIRVSEAPHGVGDADWHPFSLHVSLDILHQIAEAMKYMHDVGLAHRDLCASNVMFKVVRENRLSGLGFLNVKVAHFSLTRKARDDNHGIYNVRRNRWRAPELLKCHVGNGSNYDSEKGDVHSFGMVSFEVLTGEIPYKNVLISNLKEAVVHGDRPRLPPFCPDYLTELIQKCWHPDAHSRPTFREICMNLRQMKAKLMTGEDMGLI